MIAYDQDKTFNRKTVLLFLWLMLIIATLAGCNEKANISDHSNEPSSSDKDFPVTVTDGLNRKVTIETKPARIVSVAPQHTETLFALGLGERIVGVTDYCNYPEEAQTLEKIGGFSDPNLERIVSLKPDLVVATADQHQDIIQGLNNVGIPVLAFSPHSIEGIIHTIAVIGQATGNTAAATALNNRIQQRIDAIIAKVRDIPEEQRPRVYYELWYEPLMSVGPNTLISDLIKTAGGISITSDAKEDYPTFSEEILLSRDPQVMLHTYGHGNQMVPTAEQIASRPGWERLSFIKAGRVYSLNADLVERSGPRVVDALELIAQALYPHFFTESLDGN
ncbi:MAG: cobalamin-binding protein [Syntrophomonadaceae bacterium]|nr:cobalamin-binding protein [Syntrophomonadaceae bacterium]